MIDRTTVANWLANYVKAWKSYDPQEIGALFSEDARYFYGPFQTPLEGRDAIVASWLENRDAPNTYDAHYESIAIDGSTIVTNGRSRYFEPNSTTVTREYDNIFVLRFDDEGRCAEFREWYMRSTEDAE